MIHCLNQFHPAGHGTMFSGTLQSDSDAHEFRWIYDCGSKRPTRIREILSFLSSLWSPREIDLVCVSHFDSDHVCGLEELLRTFSIERLALPYLPFRRRLAVTAQRPDESEGNALAAMFCLDPAGFLALRGLSEGVRRLVFVRGGGGPIPDDSQDPFDFDVPPTRTLQPERRDREVRADIREPDEGQQADQYPPLFPEATSLRSGGLKVEVHGHARPATAMSRSWEFSFFNRELPTGAAPRSGASLGDVQVQVLAILQEHRDPSHPGRLAGGWLSALRSCYDKHFGHSALARNNVSLCVLSRPLVSGLAQQCSLFHLPELGFACGQVLLPVEAERQGLLLTGDLSINTDCADKMAAHFGTARWAAISVLQIPHHGAERAWRSGNSHRIGHSTSVFCVPDWDPNGQHPHSSVLLDTSNTRSAFANYGQGVTAAFHIS